MPPEALNVMNTNEPIVETTVHPTEKQDTISTKLSPADRAHAADLVAIGELVELEPEDLIVDPLIWKTLVRAIYRSRNIMITGPSGSGKTLSVYSIAKTTGRELFVFNLGATQDPRTTLIGQTHFNQEKGTYFNHSLFVKAIQTPNAIILLDEISRANHEAWNILISVLDPMQRYLRIDEEVNTPTIKVAEGVCFISTANIGVEYTATRTIDRAITDRFSIIEMQFLNKEDEKKLILREFKYIPGPYLDTFLDIVHRLREKAISDSSNIEATVGTRAVKEGASMLNDGFTVTDVLDIIVYPLFDNSGGTDSERTEVKQIVQAFV